MIHAEEKGRSLQITLGGGDDTIVLTVPPTNVKTGAQILAWWAGITFDAAPDPNSDAINMAEAALGKDTYARLEDLRAEEAEQVVQAAVLWNVKGGGMALVDQMIRDGYPKAQEALADWFRRWATSSQSPISPSGESESPTLAPDGTSGTGTRSGSDNASSSMERSPLGL